MLDLSKPIQTRDGKPARVIAESVKGTDNIIALVETEDSEYVAVRTKEGRSIDIEELPGDLVNVPVVRVEYRALDMRRNRTGRLGQPLDNIDSVARDEGWGEKCLKATYEDNKLVSVELA